MFDYKQLDTTSLDDIVRLESKRFVQSVMLPDYPRVMGDYPDVRALKDVFNSAQYYFMHRIATQVLEDTLDTEVKHKKVCTFSYEYQYPASAWQLFKEMHFPHWLLKKFPPKYKTFRGNKDQEVEFSIRVQVQNTADVYYPRIKVRDQDHYIHVYKPVITSFKEVSN